MKKFTKQLSAILTAAVMTVSAAGMSVSAKTDTEKYTGWVSSENGWQYMSNGSPYKEKSREVDGVVYDFSMNGYCIGKYTGWRSESGIKRRYSEGLPYTGWTKSKDGSRKYFLDGYAVTGDFQIGNKVYSFGSDGVYTGNVRSLTLTAECESRVSTDTEKISVTLKNLDGRHYEYGVLSQMERWEKGKWVSCFKEYKDKNGAVLAFPAIGISLTKKGETDTLDFNPQTYTNFTFTEGYYRIPIGSAIYSSPKRENYEVYAMFQAVPPVELKISEEIYLSDNFHDTTISIIADINSQKDTLKAETAMYGATIEIQKKTAAGWEDCENHDCAVGYTDNENKLEIDSAFLAEAGYYRAVVTVDGEKYITPFRVDSLTATPWLEEYSLKNGNITVSFTVHNKYCKPVKIRTDLFTLYKRENGKWEHISEAQIGITCLGEIPEYTTLESGQRTALSFNLTSYYDTSKLKAGTYAVFISGAGFTEFRLTDKEQKADEFPFTKIEASDIKEIQLIYYECGSGEIVYKSSFVGGEKLSRCTNYLRQLKFEKVIENYSNNSEGGDNFEIVVRLKNGRKKTLFFCENSAVIYNGGKVYKCGEYAYSALYDFLIENSYKNKTQ